MKKYAINILVILFLLTPFTLFANGCHANNDTIKVLAIGNSFSQDAVEQYLHELGEAEGITMIIGNMLSEDVHWNGTCKTYATTLRPMPIAK